MIYIIVFLSSILLLYFSEINGNKNQKRILVFLALMLPTLLAGLRDYSIGRDVLEYGNIWFERSRESTSLFSYISSANSQSVGTSYALLNYLVSRFTDNVHYFYFVLAYLELLLLYEAIQPFKRELSIPLVFIVYYFIYYNDSLNILRQFPAVLIVLFSYRYVIYRRFVPFAICVCLAFSFHVTAIIALCIYPIAILSESRFKKIVYVLMVGGFIGLIISLDQLLHLLSRYNIVDEDRFSAYVSGDGIIGGRFIRFALYLFLLCLFVLKKKQMNQLLSKNNMPYYNGKINNLQSKYICASVNRFKYLIAHKEINCANSLFAFCIISFIMSILPFVYHSSFIVRMSYYFDFFLLIYSPLIFRCLKIKVEYKGSVIEFQPILLFIVSFLYWFIVYVIRNGASTYPYVFMKI